MHMRHMNDLSYKKPIRLTQERHLLHESRCQHVATQVQFFIYASIYFLARHYNPIYIHRFKTCVNICAEREQYKPSQFSKRNLALFFEGPLDGRHGEFQPKCLTFFPWIGSNHENQSNSYKESVESVWNRSRLASLSRVTAVQLGFYLKNGRCVNQAKIGSAPSDSVCDWVCRPFQTDLTEFADHGSWHI